MLKVLRIRGFAWLWVGQLISGLGDWIRNMGLLLWVYQITGGTQPLATALITVASMTPALLFGIAAGALADTWDRRRVLIWCDLSRGLCSLGLLVAIATGSLPLAYVLAFTSSSIQQLYDPARGALIPALVPQKDLLAASSLRQATYSGLMMLGPALGTLVYYALGSFLAFGLDALSFLLSALCDRGVPPSGQPTATGSSAAPSLRHQVLAGLTYARQSPFVRYLLGMGVMSMLAGGALQVVDLYLVTRDLARPAAQVAWLHTAFGVTTALGFLVVGVLCHRLRRLEWLVSGGLVVVGLGLMLTSVAPGLAVALGGMVMIGLGEVSLNAGIGPLIQTHVQGEFLGRTIGTFQSLATAAALASAALGGLLANWYSARWIFGGAAALVLLTAWVAGTGLHRALRPAESGLTGERKDAALSR